VRGIKKEPRIHIFWQRRIREGDNETPYWFPAETTGGAINQGRIVLPIPPGTHWSDAKPAVLPGMDEAMKALPTAPGCEVEKKPRAKKVKESEPVAKPMSIKAGGLRFAPGTTPPPVAEAKPLKPTLIRPRMKNDPKLIAAARELRDRYIEQINQGLLLPPSACGKYDVSRQLESAPPAMEMKMLTAA
jgi:hypothetical protein